jgi:hypothetical protein
VVMGVPVTVPGHSATRSGCAASRTSTEDASAVCVSGVRSYCFVCFVLRVYSKVHHGMAQDARSRSVCAQIANRQRRVQCVASGSMKRRLQLHLSLRSPNFAQPLLYVKLLQDHVAHHDDADAADRRRPRNAALRRGLRQSQVAAMLWRGRGGLLGARRRRPTAALRRTSDNPESPRCSNRKSSNTGWSLAACTSHPELESLPAEAGGLAACSGHDDSDIAGVCSWRVVLLDENSVGG